MLTCLDGLPKALLTTLAKDLYKILPGPTLIEIAGIETQPIFISVLLHGNEDTGFQAMQQFLSAYDNKKLPRTLLFFIGNVEAARHRVRYMPGQPDYNRVWPGTDDAVSDEQLMMSAVFEKVRKRRPLMSIDIHNNTGKNPHYACINRLDDDFIYIAQLFSKVIVYFLRPTGVQSLAFANICPAVTVECGQVGQAYGVDHAVNFIRRCVHLRRLGDPHRAFKKAYDIVHTVARVQIPDALTFGFAEEHHEHYDITFIKGIETLNFIELEANTLIATVKSKEIRLNVINEAGEEVFEHYFSIINGELRLQKTLMPSMITHNKQAIRQDCFCYLMEPLG